MPRNQRPADCTRWQPFEERYWGRVNKSGGIPSYAPELGECWLWTGKTGPKGYGLKIQDQGMGMRGYPHQFAYRLENGPIPPGATIDHLCRVTRCVNPAHLEAVTARENIARGADARHKEPCRNGHPPSEKKTLPSGKTLCTECRRVAARASDVRNREYRRAKTRARYAARMAAKKLNATNPDSRRTA